MVTDFQYIAQSVLVPYDCFQRKILFQMLFLGYKMLSKSSVT